MCDPISISALALSAASTVAATAQGRANAQAMSEYQEQVHAQNTEIANTNANNQYLQIAKRTLQEREAASAAITEVSRRAAEARGTARVAAGESGTTGQSVGVLRSQFYANELKHTVGTERNLAMSEDQLQLQKKAIRAGQQSQILSTLPQPVEKPSWGLAAMRVGTDLATGYVGMTESTPDEGFLGRSFK